VAVGFDDEYAHRVLLRRPHSGGGRFVGR
jgi:hypothetical protein